MKRERTKAVLFMVLTFIVGIVIGVFIPGLVFRFRANNNPPPDMRDMPPSDRFERMIFRMVNPDSAQIEKIKPLAQRTSARIDTIQSNANKEIKGVIDSLKVNLQPILNEEQLKKLEDFGNRPRGFGRGGPGGRPGGPGRGGPGGDGPRDDERRGERPVGSTL